MRISDWSSDVCSSDLEAVCQIALFSKVTGVIPCASGGNGAIREDDNGNSCNAERTRFDPARSEEHTSELQSLMRNSYAVFCLKKKKIANFHDIQINIATDKSLKYHELIAIRL